MDGNNMETNSLLDEISIDIFNYWKEVLKNLYIENVIINKDIKKQHLWIMGENWWKQFIFWNFEISYHIFFKKNKLTELLQKLCYLVLFQILLYIYKF